MGPRMSSLAPIGPVWPDAEFLLEACGTSTHGVLDGEPLTPGVPTEELLKMLRSQYLRGDGDFY